MTAVEPWEPIGPSGSAAESTVLERALLTGLESQREWAGLINAAEQHCSAGRFASARDCQERAFRLARDRNTQGATMHHIARRWWQSGAPDRAAEHFELARALRRGFAAPELTANSEQALGSIRGSSGCDAIVLSGGTGRRVGYRDKAELPLAGWPLLDHVLLAVSGAVRRIVVGPERRGLTEPTFCREHPSGGGPVAAIQAATELVSAPEVLVLAADQPFIGSGLSVLQSALRDQTHDVAALVDVGGRINFLAARWRTDALRDALDRVAVTSGAPGAPVRALFSDVSLATVADFDAASFDCDTQADLREAEARIRRAADPREGHSRAQLPESPLAWRGLALHSPS